MTGNEMLAQLGQRLEDTGAVEYTSAIKLEAINNAQLRIMDLLNYRLLRPLVDEAASLVFTNGVYSLKDLSPLPFPKEDPEIHYGIISARVTGASATDPSDANYFTYLDSVDPRWKAITVNSYLAAAAQTGYWTLESLDTLHPIMKVLPFATTTVTLQYLKLPTDMAAGGTECQLDEGQHETVLDLAEAALWLTSNRSERSTTASNRAMAYIEAMNAPFQGATA